MKTIMKNGLKLKKNPKDYDAWCQIGLAGSFAHNGYYGLGQVEDWASHGMEHELSAWDTTIDARRGACGCDSGMDEVRLACQS